MGDIVLASEDAYFQDASHFPRGSGARRRAHVIWAVARRTQPRAVPAADGRSAWPPGRPCEWGAVNEVLPKDKLLDRAWELARELVMRPPLALRYTRQLFTQDPLKRAFLDELGHGLRARPTRSASSSRSAAGCAASTVLGTKSPGPTDVP